MGPLTRPEGTDRPTVDLRPGATVDDLLAAVGYPEGQRRFILVAVNGQSVSHRYVLNAEDAVVCSLVVGGG